MKKTLTDNEINQIKETLKTKFKKSDLRVLLDNWFMVDELEDKMNLDTWSEQDKQDVLISFKKTCEYGSNKSCLIVIKEFNKLFNFSEYKNNEYCRCCLFNLHCSAYPNNRTEDNWHYNITLIWHNIIKGPFDLDYIKDIWDRIKNSNDRQILHDIIEDW